MAAGMFSSFFVFLNPHLIAFEFCSVFNAAWEIVKTVSVERLLTNYLDCIKNTELDVSPLKISESSLRLKSIFSMLCPVDRFNSPLCLCRSLYLVSLSFGLTHSCIFAFLTFFELKPTKMFLQLNWRARYSPLRLYL